ncbi:MAG: c-type cytochrome domain-containing protein, partial [Planctomycetaceae bacterium]
CVGCHGPDVQEGGLRLDIRRRAFQGGDTAAAIVPRNPGQSELLSRIEEQDTSRRMPQGAEPLAEPDRKLLRQWIAAGAKWPDELAGTEAAPDHWAFRPVVVPTPPATHRADWAVNAID